jgi:nicotinamidase-related amidase
VPDTDSRPSTALLVMDVQRQIVERLGDAAPLDRIAGAIAAARARGIPVIYVRIAFRPGHPEISPRNRTFAALRDAGGLVDEDGTAIHQALAPEPGDVVVTKRRVSAFAGSDLDVVLRAGAIEELVLCGIATSGVVLSTLRAAADLDYALTVLRDACADGDAEVHRVLLDKVFPRQADVVDTADWAAALRGRPSGAAAAARPSL